ncbi:MAG: 50S ribosomal protein L23 [Vampirovibrio sp.]|nr:50S ribosomal protein L23 [Vampirovibrio sp.]
MAQQSELYNLLKRPIISEKSTSLAEENQYTFEVVKEANKVELVKAFELAYPGRKVEQIRLISVPSKTKRRGKKVGHTAQRKKAIFKVAGEPLELFAGV